MNTLRIFTLPLLVLMVLVEQGWSQTGPIRLATTDVTQIALNAAIQKPSANAGNQQDPFWTDRATGLAWAKRDNGADVDRDQSGSYCGNLRLGGFSDWRLPTIDELAALYDKAQAGDCGPWHCHIKGGIKLSSSIMWSGSAGSAPGEVWSFDFSNDGARLSGLPNYSANARALCVRRPVE